MVREKNVEKFHKYFIDLWTFLKKLFSDNPSVKKYLNKVVYMKHHETDKLLYIEQVLSNISPYIDYISKKDEFIFTPEFGNKPLNFLIGYDFRQIWRKLILSQEEKRIIFRYIEFLYMQASLALGKNQEKVQQIIESIKLEQDIERAVEKNPNMFGDAEASGDMTDFKSLFGNDNILVDLAQDMSQEFNIQETFTNLLSSSMGQNPLEAFKNMAENPEIRNMMEKMTKRVTERMQEKNITQEDLLKSAETLKDNLSANVAKMPGGAHLRRMINNLNMEQFATQFAGSNNNSTAITTTNTNQIDQIDQSAQTSQPMDQNKMMQQMLTNLTANLTTDDGSEQQSQFTMPPEFNKFMEQLQQSKTK